MNSRGYDNPIEVGFPGASKASLSRSKQLHMVQVNQNLGDAVILILLVGFISCSGCFSRSVRFGGISQDAAGNVYSTFSNESPLATGRTI